MISRQITNGGRTMDAATDTESGALPALPGLLAEPASDEERVVPSSMKAVRLKEIDVLGVTVNATLVASIKSGGLYQPVILQETGKVDQPYRVLAGKRRVAAAKAAGFETIPARVYGAAQKVNGSVVTLVENWHRKANPGAELTAVADLLQSGYSPRQIAADLKVPLGKVEAVVKVAGLERRLFSATAAGTVSWSVAVDAAKLTGTDQQKLAEKMGEQGGRLTQDDVRSLRDAGAVEAMAALPAELWGTVADVPDGEVAVRVAPTERMLVLPLSESMVADLKAILVAACAAATQTPTEVAGLLARLVRAEADQWAVRA